MNKFYLLRDAYSVRFGSSTLGGSWSFNSCQAEQVGYGKECILVNYFFIWGLCCFVSLSAYSELPAFLTSEGGLNSGLMMVHVTAAALGISFDTESLNA